MARFKDNAGREWTLAVTVGAIRRVRDRLKVDLLEAAETDLLSRLARDAVLLVDALWCLVEPEARQRGVTDEEFGRAMTGGALDGATDALVEALLDFFPRPQRAKALGKMLDLLEEHRRTLSETAEKYPPSGDAPGGSAGNSPESSGSTPQG
jgi:hypothetical protein